MHEPRIRELIINKKQYFHISCDCGYSVVHEWERLEEWKEHFRQFHERELNNMVTQNL